MRRLASFLLLGVALAASAKDIWRWKDADGVVHYADSPVPGAERVNTTPAPKTSSGPAPQASGKAVRETDTTPPPVRYTRCEVARPLNDSTFNNLVDTVSASVVVEPALQSGHRIQAYLNGSAYPQWSGNLTSFTFPRLDRGAYSLSIRDQFLRAAAFGAVAGKTAAAGAEDQLTSAPDRRPTR
jgi:hypothetical protein